MTTPTTNPPASRPLHLLPRLRHLEAQLSIYYRSTSDTPLAIWMRFAQCYLSAARCRLDPTSGAVLTDPKPMPISPLILEARLKMIDDQLHDLISVLVDEIALGWIRRAREWIGVARELNELKIEMVTIDADRRQERQL